MVLTVGDITLMVYLYTERGLLNKKERMGNYTVEGHFFTMVDLSNGKIYLHMHGNVQLHTQLGF